MAPYVGAPAYNAGLRPGDIIIKVDEKATDGLTTTEVADMLKGQKGTIVKIVVTREGYNEPLTFTVTRGEIPRHSVDIAFLIKPSIGYIRLSAFNETTDHEIAESLNARKILTDLGRAWTRGTVHQVLTNEKYIGNNVYHRTSR